jgi:hypothetical protein
MLQPNSVPRQVMLPVGPKRRHSTLFEIAWVTATRPVGIVSSVLIVALVVSEVLSPTFRLFSSVYPLTTGVMVGFITLAFTANVVNQLITKQLQQRWDRVRSIAMQGLNDELRTARDLFYILQYGCTPFDASLDQVRYAQDSVPASIRRILESASIPAAGDLLLKELANNSEWVVFGRRGLAEISAYLRISLARWAPLLSIGAEVSESSHSMLVNVSFIVDSVSVLEVPLAQVRLVSGTVQSSAVSPFVRLWALVSAAFVFVEETSVNALRVGLGGSADHLWRSAMRLKIAPSSRDSLDRWTASHDASSEFQSDMSSARDALDRSQVDTLTLIPAPSTEVPRTIAQE